MKEKITVTHRGTAESIRNKQNNMKLEANYPNPDSKLLRLLEDRNKVVWVSLGKPNLWNKISSGMYFKRDEACIVFEIERDKVRKPNGIGKRIFGCWIFGKAQLVIDGDVGIPHDAIFIYKKNDEV